MKKIIFFLALLFFFFFPVISYAQNNIQPENEFERGKVLKILKSGERKVADTIQPYQTIEIKILTGNDKNKILTVEHGGQSTIRKYQLVSVGDVVVLSKVGHNENVEYIIYDKYRLVPLLIILFGFFILVIGLSRFQGFTSILGMIISILVLVKFIVPQIAAGADPVTTTLLGSTVIVFISIYLAHGFNKRTSIAVASTVITLIIAVALSFLYVTFARLSGAGSEDAYGLQFGLFSNIDLRGLLLAGIIIATLGVLDDITTSLSASVDELHKANPKLSPEELFKRGISIGREHISSLVNTLVLAYAGASMPIFLFFLSIKDSQPLWVTLNNELIVEAIVSALVGSTALVLAVPITTFLAAAIYGKTKPR